MKSRLTGGLACCLAVWTVALAPAGCGGGAPAPGGVKANLDLFIGTWMPTSGTSTQTCEGIGSATSAVSESVIWTLGTKSDLVLGDPETVAAGGGVLANVTGSTARALPGQIYSYAIAERSWSWTQDTLSFALRPDLTTADEDSSGTTREETTVVCRGALHATYRKL